MRANATIVGAVALLASCGKVDVPAPVDGPCMDDATLWREQVYPQVIQSVCMGCHTADGAARDSGLVFVGTGYPDHEARNRGTFANVAGLERAGDSIVLLKPIGLEGHGGGKILSEDDASYALLQDFVDRLNHPVTCANSGTTVDGDAGLTLDSPVQTLRKAAVTLVGRLPTPDEEDAVRAGGESALGDAVWAWMDEPAFANVFMEKLNDVLLTDRYLRSNDALGIMDEDRFPGRYWFEDANNEDTLRDRTNDAVAREPLEIAAHIMREDRPWTEILTADYTMVNGYSAMAYGVDGAEPPDVRDPAAFEFVEATLPDWSHAGLLTTPAFLNRYPTTETNRNRHRAWAFYKTFLATDILTFGKRPIDPTISDVHNPTLNDPQCTVCHATMDPVAGAFQSWDDQGRLAPREEGWYPEMAPPGFEGEATPPASGSGQLTWLAEQSVADPRFAIATVRMMLGVFTGLDVLSESDVGDDPDKAQALALQDLWVADVATELVDRQWDVKVAIQRVVTSRYFRASAATGATPGQLLQAGTAHLLTPEELDRKITATTGIPWRASSGSTNLLLDRYALLYGGIDSLGITERLRDPNGVMANIARRMSNEVACGSVARDFLLDPTQRRLFPLVEMSYVPETDDGFAIPGAEDAIRENIRWLHSRLLGEELAADDPEIEATYALWVDAWKAGRAGLADETVKVDLDYRCMALFDPFTGDQLRDDHRIVYDPDFTIRSWMTVTAYLLSDYRFLYE